MIFDWVKFNLHEKDLLAMKIKKQCLGSDPLDCETLGFIGFQSVSLNDFYLSLRGSHVSHRRAEDFVPWYNNSSL